MQQPENEKNDDTKQQQPPQPPPPPPPIPPPLLRSNQARAIITKPPKVSSNLPTDSDIEVEREMASMYESDVDIATPQVTPRSNATAAAAPMSPGTPASLVLDGGMTPVRSSNPNNYVIRTPLVTLRKPPVLSIGTPVMTPSSSAASTPLIATNKRKREEMNLASQRHPKKSTSATSPALPVDNSPSVDNKHSGRPIGVIPVVPSVGPPSSSSSAAAASSSASASSSAASSSASASSSLSNVPVMPSPRQPMSKPPSAVVPPKIIYERITPFCTVPDGPENETMDQWKVRFRKEYRRQDQRNAWISNGPSQVDLKKLPEIQVGQLKGNIDILIRADLSTIPKSYLMHQKKASAAVLTKKRKRITGVPTDDTASVASSVDDDTKSVASAAATSDKEDNNNSSSSDDSDNDDADDAGDKKKALASPEGHQYLIGLVSMWRTYMDFCSASGDMGQYLAASNEIFRGCNGTRDELERYRAMSGAVRKLSQTLNSAGVLNVSSANRQQAEYLENVQDAISDMCVRRFTARQGMLNRQELNSLLREVDPNLRVDPQVSMARSAAMGEKPETDHLKLLRKLLLHASEKGLILQNEVLKQPIKSPEGLWTGAYEVYGRMGLLTEFVENAAMEDETIWTMLNSKRSYIKDMPQALASGHKDLLPKKDRERAWHGFYDGRLDVDESLLKGKICFYPYNSYAFKAMSRAKTTCAYHKTTFDHAEMEWYLRNTLKPDVDPTQTCHAKDFMDIPTPVDGIIRLQRWDHVRSDNLKEPSKPKLSMADSEEPIWVYAGGGSMLYSKKNKNNPLAKIITSHVGTGGCGKTTLLKIFSAFFDAGDIFQFKTRDEDVFGYERIADTYACFGYDLGRDWRVEHTFLYTLVDGGLSKISKKCKTYVMVDIDQPSMLAMNDFLQIPDAGGAWSRRNNLHQWNIMPPEGGNPNLQAEGEEKIGAVMIKCVLALFYLRTAILKHLAMDPNKRPIQMQQNIEDMCSQTNPMLMFFKSQEVVYDPSFSIPLNELNKSFRKFCKDQGMVHKIPTMSKATLGHILRQIGASIIMDSRPNYLGNASSNTKNGVPSNGYLLGHGWWMTGYTLPGQPLEKMKKCLDFYKTNTEAALKLMEAMKKNKNPSLHTKTQDAGGKDTGEEEVLPTSFMDQLSRHTSAAPTTLATTTTNNNNSGNKTNNAAVPLPPLMPPTPAVPAVNKTVPLPGVQPASNFRPVVSTIAVPSGSPVVVVVPPLMSGATNFPQPVVR